MLRKEFPGFAKEFFLQTYDVSNVEGVNALLPAEVIDGMGLDDKYASLFEWFERNVVAFNTAQYQIEHGKEKSSIVVKASAGTGKTTVMIDRILYLMHMVPDLKMSEIYMITFTNEATNQMNDKLQEKLLSKYSLTKNKSICRGWSSSHRCISVRSTVLPMICSDDLEQVWVLVVIWRSSQWKKNEKI